MKRAIFTQFLCFLILFCLSPGAFAQVQSCDPATDAPNGVECFPGNPDFQLLATPTITAMNGGGMTTQATFAIQLINNRGSDLVLETISFRMGYNNTIVTSLIENMVTSDATVLSNVPIIDPFNGNFVSITDFCCLDTNPPKVFMGNSYNREYIYDHTVGGANDLRDTIFLGSTDLVMTITLNFDGTETFSDVPGDPNYIGHPSRFFIYWGECLDPDPNVNNQWGFQNQFGSQLLLNCFDAMFVQPNLPLELAVFNGEVKARHNELYWTTYTEVNTKWHAIEASSDPLSGAWLEIGRVPAAGNSANPINYTLNDEEPLLLTYYRLKTIDQDGAVSYSEVIALKRDQSAFANVNVYPNPTFDQVTLQVEIEETTDISLEVTDVLGRILFTEEYLEVDGLLKEEINLQNLAAGVYFFRVDNGISQDIQRVVKQ